MSRISVRGFAVASATAVTTVGAVVGVAAGSTLPANDTASDATAADTTLLADIPTGQQAQVQTASLTQQADTQAAQADASAKKDAEAAARIQAAKDAKTKKDAAEAKVKQEREAKEAASRSSARSKISYTQQSSYTVAQIKAMAQSMMASDQYQCFSNIVDHESGWNYQAQNPTSAAYGLVQSNPGSKMASAGADWQTNPATQIKWGLNYMENRYGSPCGAWSFWQANHSY
ncbi:transglycosylase SLT domain-containing protein [Streptomyces beijiangensis]|uniref:Transglycosylase SLT domain-containing protein n=1 Tax=Streptomyces beijiangensis TaxID=163361 RepID=A0A939F4G0_9ACTN|nr:transglycosylase SLT domain-containing protein [Streptomyces beijiangensis]MBO0512110.1 transglycosylase SLT domain-containing protein [Streptomyces beijiangensis]